VQAAEKAHCEAVAATETVRGEQRAYEIGPRGPGRPPEWSHHIAVAEHQQRLAASELHDARTEQQSMREVVRGLSVGREVFPRRSDEDFRGPRSAWGW
jgi:hypothetical protein